LRISENRFIELNMESPAVAKNVTAGLFAACAGAESACPILTIFRYTDTLRMRRKEL